MIADRSPKLIWGLLALGIYVLLIGLLLYYFNVREEEKGKRYVKKNEQRIQVALSSPKKAINPQPQTVPKPVVKPKPKTTSKPKKVVKSQPKPQIKPKPAKVETKKVMKEKVVKKVIKKKDVNMKKTKKKPLDLFANVKTPPKKNIITVTDKPVKSKPKSNLIKVTEKKHSASELINTSLKNQKSSDSGVEDAYLAKVQSMLEGWPAQSEYAGEKVKVHLFIDPTGSFEFEVKSASNNDNFNRDLIEYLKQLQVIGFGRHKGSRTYKFEAEFIAKE